MLEFSLRHVNLARTGAFVATVMSGLGVGLLMGCAEPIVYEKADPLDARRMAMWSDSCALCHVSGEAGAPRMGHYEEWEPRLHQGSGVLLEHTVAGFNMMPPLGYCMGCEVRDFERMIEFMAGVKLDAVAGAAP